MPDDLLEKRSGHTQSVSRALSLLSKLAEEPDGFNLSELARRVKLAPSFNNIATRPICAL